MKKGEGISEVIRYEEELKAKVQQTETVILDGRLDRQQLDRLKGLIEQEEVLLKYLEIESTRLQPEVRNLYARNMLRFKKKIKQHKEYVNSQFGQGAVKNYRDPYKVGQTLKIQQQNAHFLDQKQTMHQNQQLHGQIGRDLHKQGFYLQNNITRNRQIREQADQASNNIKLIKQAIAKRKFMFYSLFILTVLAVIFVFMKKILGNKL